MSDCATYLIVTFPSTHAALSAEKKLKDEGVVGVEFIPVPRDISSDCGVCMRLDEANQKIIEKIEYESLWRVKEVKVVNQRKKERSYERIG